MSQFDEEQQKRYIELLGSVTNGNVTVRSTAYGV